MRDYKKLHDDACVIDWHTHLSLKTAIFHRDLCKDYKRRLFGRAFFPLASRTDFPKLLDGGIDVCLSVCYVPEMEWADDLPVLKVFKWLKRPIWKRLFGAATYFDASMAAIMDVEEQFRKHNATDPERKIVVCKSRAILERYLEDGFMCLVHAVEGGHSLQGELLGKRHDSELEVTAEMEDEVLRNLMDFRSQGCAYLTLAHFYPNYLTSPVFPYPEYASKFSRWRKMLSSWNTCNGLTDLGEKVVRSCFELGMIVDINHCTPLARSRVYEIADEMGVRCRVIASHAGVYSEHADQYNLEDWEIEWIAGNGGVVAVILMNYWLAPYHTELGLNEISSTIRHIVEVGGIGAVSIGTDFDGFTDPPDEIEDMRSLPTLTMRLASEMKGVGEQMYSDEDIKKILGGNALRVLLEGWDNGGLEVMAKKRERRDDKDDKKDDRRNYKLDKIAAVTEKAKAVAVKRKWLVFLIAIALAAYLIFSGGGGGGILNGIKSMIGF